MNLVRADAPDAIRIAAEAVRNGGTVIYPTDTLYGIGADARSTVAVRRVDMIKDREGKPMSVVVTDLSMAERYCRVNALAKEYAAKLLPGPYTFVIYRKGEGIARNVAGDTIGIRIPDSRFPVELVRELGYPITSTSANKTGKPSACRLEEVDGEV